MAGFICCGYKFSVFDGLCLIDTKNTPERQGGALTDNIHYFAMCGFIEYEAYPNRYMDKPLCIYWPTEKLLNAQIVEVD